MDKQTLIDAIKGSGGSDTVLGEAEGLLERINFLESTGRYQGLLSQLAKSNDSSNFQALTLEANFAFQFESRKQTLAYEVKQLDEQTGSVDFLRKAPTGHRVYLELRLLQEAQRIKKLVNAQLSESPFYQLAMDGDDEQGEIARIQSTILSKVEDKTGKPVKFLSTDNYVVNVVVVDATTAILGTIDGFDCMLALYGDPSVEEHMRRGIFGLFQDDRPEYPKDIHERAAKYEHIRSKLHGVLFLFKAKGAGVLVYDLEACLLWNPALMNLDSMTEDDERAIRADIEEAIPRRQDREDD